MDHQHVQASIRTTPFPVRGHQEEDQVLEPKEMHHFAQFARQASRF